MTRPIPLAFMLKEGRALAPIWLAAAATVVAGRSTGEFAVALFAFVLGAVALGVYSIGHEYALRTLTGLLAQPLSRSRLLLSKMTVLATFVALLTIVAARALLPVEAFEAWRGNAAAARWWLWMLLLTPLLALFMAPWLTMLSRSVMGGLVFTLAVPAGLWIAGQIARVTTLGFTADEFAYGPALTLMIAGLLAVSGVAAVHGRTTFLGLEAIDAPRDFAPSTRKTSARATELRSRRRHPVVVLAQKELRLYPLAFVVAALYALVWIVMRLTRMDAYIAGQSFQAVSGLYGVFIAMLVGAVSSAEERSLGTAEWQQLQPWAQWKQWLVKLATAAALAVLLGLAVPMLLERAFPLIADTGSVGPRGLLPYVPSALRGGAGAILVVVLASAYVSTMCVGALRALLMTLPLVVGMLALFQYLTYGTWRFAQMVIESAYGAPVRDQYGNYRFNWWWKDLPTASWHDLRTAARLSDWLSLIVVAAALLLIFALAYRNSRSAERGMTIARTQLPWVATYVAFGSIVMGGATRFFEWWLLTH